LRLHEKEVDPTRVTQQGSFAPGLTNSWSLADLRKERAAKSCGPSAPQGHTPSVTWPACSSMQDCVSRSDEYPLKRTGSVGGGLGESGRQVKVLTCTRSHSHPPYRDKLYPIGIEFIQTERGLLTAVPVAWEGTGQPRSTYYAYGD